MAVLAECPLCHNKQSVRNRTCKCGADLVKLKRQTTVKYWIQYRLPGGKQQKECVGYSIEEAKTAEGKRKTQKRENRIFDIKPEAKMTFAEFSKWYLGLEKVKALSSFSTRSICLNKFTSLYGDMIVAKFKPEDLERLQATRKSEGSADATIDQEVGSVRNTVYRAFDNDMVGARTL